jgi:hypothetical protein
MRSVRKEHPSGGAKTQRHLATAQGHQRGGHAEAGEHGLPGRHGMSLGDLDQFVDLVVRQDGAAEQGVAQRCIGQRRLPLVVGCAGLKWPRGCPAFRRQGETGGGSMALFHASRQ